MGHICNKRYINPHFRYALKIIVVLMFKGVGLSKTMGSFSLWSLYTSYYALKDSLLLLFAFVVFFRVKFSFSKQYL
jgi:hypothetical protein